MKTFRLESDYDGNEFADIREYTYEEALISALHILGFNLFEIESDEEED